MTNHNRTTMCALAVRWVLGIGISGVSAIYPGYARHNDRFYDHLTTTPFARDEHDWGGSPPPDAELVAQCRAKGLCTWITGTLVPPGEHGAPDRCERVSPETGLVVDSWPVALKFHVFWNSAIFNSGWFDSCDRSWWPFAE